tara:strand:+ start:1168 stop:1941 length:774 start_codon:yes stop_codon:yes gene_type:complete
MDLINTYTSYLSYLNRKRKRDSEEFHASSAGSCYRKQLYGFFDYEKKELDDKSLRLLRLGTIAHSDIEKAVNWKNDIIQKEQENLQPKNAVQLYTEQGVSVPKYNLVGTYDVGEALFTDGEVTEFNLYDFKTVAAYKWTTKFGRKVNRVASTDTNYKLQLGSYALAIKEEFGDIRVNMFLVWYNKNTSMMREQIVSSDYINQAKEYWEEMNRILKSEGEDFEKSDFLAAGMSYGVPFQDWECNYCQYSNICPSKLIK